MKQCDEILLHINVNKDKTRILVAEVIGSLCHLILHTVDVLMPRVSEVSLLRSWMGNENSRFPPSVFFSLLPNLKSNLI